MLLQTNSYIVPKERRAEHARLIRRFRQALARIGCDQFDVYEQIGANWDPTGANGRYVQLMRFRDQQHQIDVQEAERVDAGAQAIIAEFCALINFPYQQQHGYFATGFYTSVMPISPQSADASSPHAPIELHAQVPTAPAAHGTPIAYAAPVVAEVPEPNAAEHASLSHQPPAFGETAIADTLEEERQAYETLGVAPQTQVVETSEDLTAEDKLALADEPAGLDAFGLSDEPGFLAEESPPIPQVVASNQARDLPFKSEPTAPVEAYAPEFHDDSDLLDLSAIELTDDEAAIQNNGTARHPIYDVADQHLPRGESEVGHDRLILDATLPEEDAFGNLFDAANIGDHVPVSGSSQAHESIETDAELLEFNAFLRQTQHDTTDRS